MLPPAKDFYSCSNYQHLGSQLMAILMDETLHGVIVAEAVLCTVAKMTVMTIL